MKKSYYLVNQPSPYDSVHKKLYYFILFLSSLFSQYLVAQKPVDIQIQDGVKKFYGIQEDSLSPEWKAHWIWRKGQNSGENVMLCARKTFELPSKPSKAILYVTADSNYSLWVNGEFINRGPARSAPHHQSYDILDISSKLVEGENLLAFKVHHSGKTETFIDKVRPGLLFQLEIETKENQTVLMSDQLVKVKNEMGWDTETPQVSGSNMARIENFDLRKSVPEWNQPGFNDSNWETAVLLRQEWWPPRDPSDIDLAIMSPWHKLVPRDIPYLIESTRAVKNILEMGEYPEFSLVGNSETQHIPILKVIQNQIFPLEYCKVTNEDSFLNKKGVLNIQSYRPQNIYSNEPFRSVRIVFDMGEIVMGYPIININAPEGAIINITYATSLLDGKFNPAVIPGNWGDQVIYPEGKTEWEAQELRTFRYMGIYIGNTGRPVDISFAGLKQTQYPFQPSKPMKLGNEILEKLAEASKKTIRIITDDAYTDNYRERRQYIQTAWYAALGNYSTFGDPYLMRRALIQIANNQFPNGFLPMHAPGKPKAGILEANFFWHMGLYDYFLFTDDIATTKSLLGNLKRNLIALEELENKDGVLDSPPHPYWIDHTGLNRRGINFTLNGWYALALEKDGKLFRFLGDIESAENCEKKVSQIKEYLKTNFWNESAGLFAETLENGQQSSSYDEISNGVALILEIANEDQKQSIAEKIKNNDLNEELVRPVLMMYWPIKGLLSAGFMNEALGLLESRYAVMMQHEEATLWEGWNLYTFNQNGKIFPKSRSMAQAEQVFHPDIFSKHLLGYEIIEPGSGKIQISYQGYNKNMEAFIPTPFGKVEIIWILEGETKSLQLHSPNEVEIILAKSTFPGDLKVSQRKY